MRLSNIYIVGAFGALSLLILYELKSLDDNVTVRWNWTVSSFELFLSIIIVSIALGYLFTFFKFRRYKLFILSISFIFTALFWKQPEILLDASRYFTYAKTFDTYGLGHFIRGWGSDFGVWTDLPMAPLLYGITFKLFGESRLAVQVLNSLLFSFSALLTYLIGRELWSREAGFLASLFLLSSPYLFTQVPLFLVDIASLFFLALALYTFIKALGYGGLWIPASALAIFAALMTKYSLWLFLLPLPLFLIIGNRRNGAKALAFAGLLFLAVLAIKSQVFQEQLRLLLGYQSKGLKRWGESYISTFFFQVHPFLTLAAIYILGEGLRRRSRKVALLVALILPVFLLRVERIRYLLPLFPVFALLAGHGIERLKLIQKSFIPVSACIFSLLFALSFYLPFNIATSSSNLMHAGHYLDRLEAGEVAVLPLTSYGPVNPRVTVPLLDIYTQKRITVVPYNYTPPPEEELKTSPLRFTWEYELPEYYSRAKGKPEVIVVVTGEKKPIPGEIEKELEDYRLIAEYRRSQGLFDFTTLVSIYTLT